MTNQSTPPRYFYLYRCGYSDLHAIGERSGMERLLPKDKNGRQWRLITRLRERQLGPYRMNLTALGSSGGYHIFKMPSA